MPTAVIHGFVCVWQLTHRLRAGCGRTGRRNRIGTWRCCSWSSSWRLGAAAVLRSGRGERRGRPLPGFLLPRTTGLFTVMPAAVSKPGGPPNLGLSSDKQAAGMPFSTMDQNFPKYALASDGVGGSSAFPTQEDRWSGYEEIDVPERERGWMPRQRTTLDTQRRARQKKNQHNVVVGSKVRRCALSDAISAASSACLTLRLSERMYSGSKTELQSRATASGPSSPTR